MVTLVYNTVESTVRLPLQVCFTQYVRLSYHMDEERTCKVIENECSFYLVDINHNSPEK